LLATLRHRDFALLWIAGLISVAGDFALIAALPLHAYALTGSAVAAGGVFAASLLPRILLGSVAGVFVDRWDRKRAMIAVDLLRAALLLPLLAVGSPDLLWLLYLVRAGTGALGLIFGPAESALLPRLVSEDRLLTANALNTLNNNLGRLVGPAAGGVLYATGGLGTVVLVDSLTFAISAALIAAIRANARPERTETTMAETSAWGRAFGEWRAGLQQIRQNQVLAAIFVAMGIGMVGEGTFEVGFVPLVLDVFKGGAEGVGVLLSAQAIGGIIAGALVAHVAERLSPRFLLAGGFIGLGCVDLGMVNSGALATPGQQALILASVFMILAGFPAVAGFAAINSVLQMETTDEFRGRVFGALGAIEGFSILVGLAVGGVAVDAIGPVPVLSAGAAMWILGGILALLRLPKDVAATAPDEPIAGTV
jgi:MFS family permease